MATPSIKDRDWVAGRLADGASVSAIAKEAAVSRQSAHTWLSRHGLHGTPQAKPRPSKTKLRRLYTEGGSAAAVGKALGVAAGTAHRWLIDAGVQLREPGTGRPRRDLDVEALRRRRAEGATLAVLAAEFGAPPETIRRRLADSVSG